MASSLDKWFAPFEGTRSPYPIALFRIAFFGGLALHFIPALLWLDESYRPGALRSREWSDALYDAFPRIPHTVLEAGAIATILGILAGLVGFRPRAAALVAGLGCYAFASVNGMPVQTLALVDAWAVLLLWMIWGGGGAVWSVDATLRRRRDAEPPREPRLLPALVLYQVLLAVFFAGVEKVLAGWPFTDEMGIVLSYPKGFIVRDWVAASPTLHGAGVTSAMSWFTILVELGTPVAILFRRTRVVALVLYEMLFLGIIAMLEVPPLFYATFAFGALLALDDEQVEWLRSRLGRLRRREPAVTSTGSSERTSP